LCKKHGGLTSPAIAGKLLEVSKQRVYQLIEDGRINAYEFSFGVGADGKRLYVGCDDIEALRDLERDTQFRYHGEVITA
jgi:hypothetical protein